MIMNDLREDNDQFKLSMDDTMEDAAIPAAVDELRIEKLSTRVTLISILIPVLIVVIVVITYLDIKKRVLRTEDTGTIEVQKLSKDLESRFSSLSLSQARLEESLNRFIDQNNRSLAAIQVKLKKSEDHLEHLKGSVVNQKEMHKVTEDVQKQMNTTAETLDEVTGQIATLSQKLQNQMSQLEAGLADSKAQLDGMEQKLIELDKNKIDKPAMDLALRLETLRIEQDLKAQLDTIQNKVLTLEKQISQHPTHKSPSSPAPPTSPKSAPSGSKPANQRSSTRNQDKIEEQAIPR